MTVYEKIKNMTVEELAEYLCDIQPSESCDLSCPARDNCGYHRNGMIAYLESEATENG